MSVFFTSDTHFGHTNILKYCKRPGLNEQELAWLSSGVDFQVRRESVEQMNEYLLEGINSLVGVNDTLYHVGDFCFAPKYDYFKAAERYRNQIKCKNVHLIWGNHDNYSIRPLFQSCHDLLTVNVEKQRIVLCHYAMAVWEKSHRGVWHLYGHSHSNAEPWLDEKMPGRRSFDCGVDQAALVLGNYRPWSFDEVKAIMDSRKGCSIDHHGRE